MGFYYVAQDNYYLARLNAPQPERPVNYLYSDGATSCLILIVTGRDLQHHPIVALAHLSCPERLAQFFDLVEEQFVGAVMLFAQGANPPTAEAARANAQAVREWVQHHRRSCQRHADWHLARVSLALGTGRPQETRDSCYGIDLNTLAVSQRPWLLTETQRDPTGGVQTLFAVFGLQMSPPMPLHNAAEPFSPAQIARLVQTARAANWPAVLTLTDAEILYACSSTPADEPPWFVATIRASARYVQYYQPPL